MTAVNSREAGNFTISEHSTVDSNLSVCFYQDIEPVSIALQIVLSLAILVLNGLVIGLIVYNKKKTFRKPTFIFIVGLSTADMFLSICLLVLSGLMAGAYQLSAFSWVGVIAFASISFNVSVNFLLIIAFDRLIFIAYNTRYKDLMTTRVIGILITLSWLVGIIPVSPLTGNVGSCAPICTCQSGQVLTCSHPSCSKIVNGFSKDFCFGLFFYFLTMLLAISGLYWDLFRKVHRQSVKVASHSNETKSRRMQREFKLARTLGLVIMIFFICWSPIMISYVIDFADDSSHIDKMVMQVVTMPSVLNSVLNPIIYAARIPILKQFFCKCWRRSEIDSSGETSFTKQKRSKIFVKKTYSLRSVESIANDMSSIKEKDCNCPVSNAPAATCEDNAKHTEQKLDTSKKQKIEFIRLNDDISIATHERSSFIENCPAT